MLAREFRHMKNARAHKTVTHGATRRASKFVTLTSASAVIIAIVGFAAGASTNNDTPARLAAGSFSFSNSVLISNDSTQRHHKLPTTTTTLSVGTTTTLLSGTTTTPSSTTTTAPLITTTSQPPVTTTTVPSTTTTTPPPATATTTTVPVTTTTATPSSYPIGLSSSSEPSGMAPPGAGALAGYTQSYVTDFSGSSMPIGWDVYTGKPGGDPGAQFGAAHAVVGSGLLQLNTWQDAAYGNAWVTGGVCQCGAPQTYGAYFVRSRLTGAGPTGVEILWPAANTWPPEVDFNETFGGTTNTTATVHYGASNSQIQRSVKLDMTQWHTWGVIWTAATITYTVDGNVWGTVTTSSAIPNQAMWLTLQQQTWCASGWACPTAPQSMQVDWVAEYTAH
jgi:hypothetical protein